MDLDHIRELAREMMGGRRAMRARETGHLFFHGERVAKIALQIADAIHYDGNRDVLYVACLFHDCCKGLEPHNELAGPILRQRLREVCDAKELQQIDEIIRHHTPKGIPGQSTPIRILQDADILDHVGPMSVWLGLFWAATFDETVEKKLAYIFGSACEGTWAKWGSQLQFDVSRKSFERRLEMARHFFRELERAESGELF